MAYRWLKGPREAAALTQEALAAALQINNVKTIQRLERCGSDTPRQINYTALATALGVSSIQLAEDHARDLTTARLMDHARRAREAADRLRRAKHFQAIDPAPIQSALATCWATGLIERIADRDADLAGEQAQAERIAQLLNDGQLDKYTNLIDVPLEETIEQSATVEQLDTLERFLRVIIRACSAKDQDLQPGHWYLHHGESKAWPFRALIDYSCGLDGMRWVRTAPNTREARLDDGSESTRAVRSGKVSQLSPVARLHQLVCAIADTLGTVDSDKPAVGDSDAFVNYCRVVNGELFRHNNRHSHVFGLWEQYTCEPDEVKQALLEKLPALRVFECGDPKRASTVLRADSDLLETWYAGHLRTIEARRKILATTPTSSPRATRANPTAESTRMNEPETPSTNVNVTIHSGNGNINLASGHAHAQQYNLGTSDAELLRLLSQLLAVTDTAEPRYLELRKACRTAQGELEEAKVLTAPTRTWLAKTIEALPTADRVLDVAHKVTDLLSRVPGLGA